MQNDAINHKQAPETKGTGTTDSGGRGRLGKALVI